MQWFLKGPARRKVLRVFLRGDHNFCIKLQISSIFDALHFLTPSGPVTRKDTLSMEQIGQNYGFILYRTIIPVSGPAADLGIPGLRDRGIVFVNQVCNTKVVDSQFQRHAFL